MSTITTTLGSPVPPFTAHAISVSLPTWEDAVGYEEGEKRVVDAMVSGYPRFFIALNIQKVSLFYFLLCMWYSLLDQLSRIMEQKFSVNGEHCLLFPTRKIATACRTFIVDRSQITGSTVPVRLVQFVICPEDNDMEGDCIELHIVLFPPTAFPLAKQFWQHTGLGISSRLAEKSLITLPDESKPTIPSASRPPSKPSNRHYSAKPCRSPPVSPTINATEGLNGDHSAYLEERYGRNLPIESAAAGKRAMRRRIAGVLVRDSPSDWSQAGKKDTELGPSTRGVSEVTEDDVYLYPSGMSAIWNAHQLALSARPAGKSVCFG